MWYVVYTKPGKEDSVTFLLQNRGIEILNPKLKLKKYKRNKLAEVIEPLFPCYLFANFNKDEYAHLITYTRGVRYIVGKHNPVPVHCGVIDTIKESMVQGNIIVLKPGNFKRGDKVIVKDGPFRNFFGIFEKQIKGPERVIILLDTIHYKLELDGALLAVA